MKFNWCTITVKDMEQSLRFYREIVGLALSDRHAAGPGIELAFLGDGETKVELICNQNDQSENLYSGVSLGFEVPSLEEKMRFIECKGIKLDSGPFEPNPYIRFFFVRDPNGLKIQFVERR